MRIAMGVSGTGSILKSMLAKGVPLTLVLADGECKALDIARQAGVPILLINRRFYGFPRQGWNRRAFSSDLARALNERQIDLHAMAGFMTILDPGYFQQFLGQTLNIHPALLPKFPGATAVADSLAAGETITGSTIHIATEVLDDATYIVEQWPTVPVYRDDTVDSLHERIKIEERERYPAVLFKILSGAIDLAQIKRA